MCKLPDEAEWAAWEAKVADELAALTPQQRAHALGLSIYEVWGKAPPFGVGGENGVVGYYDTRTEAENAIIIGMGVFEDDKMYQHVFGTAGAN